MARVNFSYICHLGSYYTNAANVILLDAVYDKAELDYLRGNALCYIHTHSFCGAAPSFVEAMCLGLPFFLLDVEHKLGSFFL